MPFRRIEKLPSVQNVAVGQTSVLHCPVGMTYDFIDLILTDLALAEMTNIEIKINGKTVQSYATGTLLDQINTYHGRTAFQNGVLRIWFMRPELPALQIPSNGMLIDQRYLTSLGTADVATLSVQWDNDAGATGCAVEAYAQKSDPQPLGIFVKAKSFPRSFATTGQQEIDTLPRSGARIAAIHLFKADVSKVDVEVDGRKIYDVTKTLGEEIQTDFGKTPITAAATHIDFIANGSIEDALKTYGVKDMRLRPTIDTTGSVNTIVEYLDGFEGI